jgi:ABC-2 type transport system ATP-binding protein
MPPTTSAAAPPARAATSSPPLIEADRLVKCFGTVRALDELSLGLPTGVITALLGPNGAGKTTLIRTIATLARPDAGRLAVLGRDVVRQPAAVRRLIGLAGQSAAVEATMTGRENLVMVARLYGRRGAEARRAADAVLERLALGDVAGRPVRTYSGGQRRRLDLGASLVGEPRLLLLDEPTTGLDPRSRNELWQAIRELGAAGTEILLTTQYLDEADQLAGRIVIVDAGRVVAEGSPGELKARAGMDRIEVHVRDGADLDAATAVLATLGDGAPDVDAPARRASVPCVDGASRLADATTGLRAAGVAIEDLTLRRPTLDEVFLSLTGHGTRAEHSEASGKRRRPRRRGGRAQAGAAAGSGAAEVRGRAS